MIREWYCGEDLWGPLRGEFPGKDSPLSTLCFFFKVPELGSTLDQTLLAGAADITLLMTVVTFVLHGVSALQIGMPTCTKGPKEPNAHSQNRN